MKNVFKVLFVSLIFAACQQKIEPVDIAKLNGYWEIEKVVFDKDEDKDYGMNESYDYFMIEADNTGTRQKVMPQLDGTFVTNDVREDIKVRFKGGKVFLDYSTPYMKWSEELVELTDSELILLNAEKKEYHYKKAGPINFIENGKKAK